MSKKIKHLVVDTTAFIKAASLQDMADHVYTVQGVVDEITNDRQRKKLVVLPYDLIVKDVFTENIKFISDFAKKTGDYNSLSATDIQVMALTYQIEKEKVGTDHLKTEPTMQKTIKVTGLSGYKLHPESDDASEATEKNNISNDTKAESVEAPQSQREGDQLKKVEVKIEDENEEDTLAEKIAEQIKNLDLKSDEDVDALMVKVSDDDDESDDGESDSEESDNDDDWITPSNVAQKKKEMDLGEFEDKIVEVACITSDFAMQNVLKQIGLNVTAIDGRVIKQLRTFIFRCTTCFKTTSIMTKLFCPKCGHAALKKVAVSIDDDGNQHIHINGRKRLSTKGTKFSLPTPKGGQHFQYPILTEDQKIQKRFATKMARNKTKALDPDYTAGFSPFVMRDVNSRSAVLGVRADKQDVKYWMKHYSKGKKK